MALETLGVAIQFMERKGTQKKGGVSDRDGYGNPANTTSGGLPAPATREGLLHRDPLLLESTPASVIGSPIMSPTGTPVRGTFNWGEISQSPSFVNSPVAVTTPQQQLLPRHVPEVGGYPEPFLRPTGSGPDGEGTDDVATALHVGSTILPLPSSGWATCDGGAGANGGKEYSFDFDASFVATTNGLVRLGAGLRVVAHGDRLLAEWAMIGQVVVN